LFSSSASTSSRSHVSWPQTSLKVPPLLPLTKAAQKIYFRLQAFFNLLLLQFQIVRPPSLASSVLPLRDFRFSIQEHSCTGFDAIPFVSSVLAVRAVFATLVLRNLSQFLVDKS
jgi:hypothetical protein